MAIIKKGGSNPHRGQVMTTMGYRDPRPPLCIQCGERREGQIYTISPNGQVICADCAGASHAEVLQQCDPETCACGEEQDGFDPPAA